VLRLDLNWVVLPSELVGDLVAVWPIRGPSTDGSTPEKPKGVKRMRAAGPSVALALVS